MASLCAAILAIGTEVVSGQIINKNAATLSQNLESLGIETVLHITVADDREAILSALDHVTKQARLIFVCGGLGPTRDDFTRSVFAEFVCEPLEFHEPSLVHIRERLGRLGVPVAESNRQQCDYPRGSIVITNREGTANAFAFHSQRDGLSTHYWVLPGPPREIHAVWPDVAAQISALIPTPERLTLHTWQCLGKSEAELGEIVERALDGSRFTTGYRVHMPYIEIKVWVPPLRALEASKWFTSLESAIAPWFMGKTPGEVGLRFQEQVKRMENQGVRVRIIDQATQGYLGEKLRGTTVHLETSYVSNPQPSTLPSEQDLRSQITHQNSSLANTLTLWIQGFDPEGGFVLALKGPVQWRFEKRSVPYPKTAFLERSGRWVTEIAMHLWSDWMSAEQNTRTS